MGLTDRINNAWNAFMNKDPTKLSYEEGASYAYRPDRMRYSRSNERTIITAILNRIAMDGAGIDIKHVKVDSEGRYISDVNDGLNNCLTFEANIDQTGRAFIQDIIQSMLDEGCVAAVPIDVDVDPESTESYIIHTMRTAQILEWRPRDIKIRCYNDRNGRKQDLWVPKEKAAIIENPLYAVMNEPNSTVQRLSRKLSLLDVIDEQSGSGKLDLIIQLPYAIKTDAKRAQAKERAKDIERQLSGSKYGIAYTDATEHITQLNRSVENNLMNQIEYLTNMVYSQLGITQEILNGSADDKTFNNYYNRTVEPILSAIVDEFKRKFLSKTARTQGHSIKYFRSPFKLISPTDLADLADKLTRNEIMTSNEIRQIIGMKPSADPNADQLRNKNISQSNEQIVQETPTEPLTEEEYARQMAELDKNDADLDELERMVNS